MLIRDGATLIRSAADVIEALGGSRSVRPVVPKVEPVLRAVRTLPGPVPVQRPLADIAALHSRILDRLGPSPLAEDQLIRDLAMPAAFVAPELLSLELEGRIQRQAGGLLSRIG